MLCQCSFNIEDWLAGACVFQPFFQTSNHFMETLFMWVLFGFHFFVVVVLQINLLSNRYQVLIGSN